MSEPITTTNWDQIAMIANVIIAIVTVILATVAIFGKSIGRWLRRPILDVEARCQLPDCRKTSFNFLADVYYFRILVTNKGKSAARNVEVYVTQLLKKEKDGTYKIRSSFSPDNLKWSNINKSIYPAIPPNSGRLCVVFHIVDPSKRVDPSLKTLMEYEDANALLIPPGKTIMNIDTATRTNRKDYLQLPGEYRLDIVVSAENSSSVVHKELKIIHTGDWYSNEDHMLSDGVGLSLL
jgi:hypothetical protein